MIDISEYRLGYAMRISPQDSIGVPVFIRPRGNAYYLATTDYFNRIESFHPLDQHSYCELQKINDDSSCELRRGNHTFIPFWLDGSLYVAPCEDTAFSWLTSLPESRKKDAIVEDIINAVTRTSSGYHVLRESRPDLTEEFQSNFSDILIGSPPGTQKTLNRFKQAFDFYMREKSSFFTSYLNSAEPYSEVLLFSKAAQWFSENYKRFSPTQLLFYFNHISIHINGDANELEQFALIMLSQIRSNKRTTAHDVGKYISGIAQKCNRPLFDHIWRENLSPHSALIRLSDIGIEHVYNLYRRLKNKRIDFRRFEKNAYLQFKKEGKYPGNHYNIYFENQNERMMSKDFSDLSILMGGLYSVESLHETVRGWIIEIQIQCWMNLELLSSINYDEDLNNISESFRPNVRRLGILYINAIKNYNCIIGLNEHDNELFLKLDLTLRDFLTELGASQFLMRE